MIVKVESEEQLTICLDIIHKSFQTVADELNLTIDNCPGHTAFMPMERLYSQFKSGTPMFLFEHKNNYVGYFSLSIDNENVELNNLAVIPECRHLGIGKDLVEYAISFSKNIGASKINIGIVEENTVLKEWYRKLGFVHTGTKKFKHLPFTVGFMEFEMESNFIGFNKKTNAFLFELQFCNTNEKQKENLVKYKEYITTPINLLYFDMLEIVSQFNVDFETKPARCISTPYTDRRFSPNTPLKEYMYMRFRQANKKTDILGLYFDMGSESYGYGLKIYKPTSKGMDLFREKISNDVMLYSKLINDLVLKGFDIAGEKYKTDHFPDVAECSAKELLNMKCFSISKCELVNEKVYSRELKTELSNAFLNLKKFVELLAR